MKSFVSRVSRPVSMYSAKTAGDFRGGVQAHHGRGDFGSKETAPSRVHAPL